MTNLTQLDEISSVCTTPKDLIKSSDFMRGLDIILSKTKKFNREYIISLFTKIQNDEVLDKDEKEDLTQFITDEKVSKLGQELLSKLSNVSINAKSNNPTELFSFSVILENIFSEDGYKKVAHYIGEVSSTIELTLSHSYISQANVLEREGKFKEAIIMYDKAIEIDSNNASAYIGKAISLTNLLILLEDSKMCDEAITLYDQAIKITPDSVSFYKYKAIALHHFGKLEESEEVMNQGLQMCDEAIQVNPNNIELYLEKVEFMFDLSIRFKGYAEKYFKSIDKAIEIYDNAIQANSSDLALYLGKLKFIQGLGDYTNIGIDLCNKILELWPDHIIIYNVKWQFLLIKQYPSKLTKIYEMTSKLLNGNGNLYSYSSMGMGIRDEEETAIKGFIRNNNFIGLRDYILRLEKDENIQVTE